MKQPHFLRACKKKDAHWLFTLKAVSVKLPVRGYGVKLARLSGRTTDTTRRHCCHVLGSCHVVHSRNSICDKTQRVGESFVTPH